MQEPDKDRILNFLTRNETIRDFESWVYHTPGLESRVGSQLYSELIEPDYKDKFVIDHLSSIIIGNYISRDDFERFKYISVLQDSGWYPNRRIKVNLSRGSNTPEMKNAVKIIEEFGGLKFVSPDKRENWTPTLVEFLEVPIKVRKMIEYGLNKNLVCFATAHNDHINLFVDEDNQFYQLDNVVAENLYQYKGHDFEQMMRQLLRLNEEDKFEIVGRKRTR
ncbi:MAG: hypothetical protein Roseis3KO_17810 [Roseivirga sp.]